MSTPPLNCQVNKARMFSWGRGAGLGEGAGAGGGRGVLFLFSVSFNPLLVLYLDNLLWKGTRAGQEVRLTWEGEAIFQRSNKSNLCRRALQHEPSAEGFFLFFSFFPYFFFPLFCLFLPDGRHRFQLEPWRFFAFSWHLFPPREGTAPAALALVEKSFCKCLFSFQRERLPVFLFEKSNLPLEYL